MIVLVLNCGSSSLKYQLFDMNTEKVLVKGLYERIGLEGSRLIQTPRGKETITVDQNVNNHQDAIEIVIDNIIKPEFNIISSIQDIGSVGHRVVHGGEEFKDSVIINKDVIIMIEECSKLAPLHNKVNLQGVMACMSLFGNIPQIAVFDTSFHQQMPPKAFLYALPIELYSDLKVRKYGFHGTSHKYVSGRVQTIFKKENLKIISCHLGNGASICAIDNGVSVDTSMGFTPLDGIVMGTRSGRVDPAIITFLMGNKQLSAAEIEHMLNKKSGVLGLSKVSSDFRDVEEEAIKGNKQAKTALEVFIYSVVKEIGAYAAAMNGVDVIVFTAGVGENDSYIRTEVCRYLGYLGLEIDEDKNRIRGKEEFISSSESRVKVIVIPTNEELLIAKETVALVDKRKTYRYN